ncbi:hypothetical protein COO91_00492 [Nostoc flagelliforme CCNUN1]|uniref:Uncharacterized protein n=1 Tax=Nostoc flagelliforme CCNUN1 TaxID=2038116 RepID=A0A2K8SHB4_9NOSO|nr:hypothetical protein COO91_00492 [Nostoc flagelliforme CCNUN1]
MTSAIAFQYWGMQKVNNSKLKIFQTKRSALRGLRALWQLRGI